MRVIVTRPQKEADQWVHQLAQAGFDTLAVPLIGVLPAGDATAVRAAWQRIAGYDAVMFVSGNAVDHFFALKPAVASVFSAQAAIKIRAFVTGPGSRNALLRAQVDAPCIDAPDSEAGQFDSEALWAVVAHRVLPGYRVLVVRGSGSTAGVMSDGPEGAGRDWFASQVRAAGGKVDFVASYQRCLPQLSAEQSAQLHQAASDGSVWLFSSSEAIANLVQLCPQQSWGQARAVVTHPRIGQAARVAGFSVVCESRPTLAAVTASIESMP